VVDLGELGGVTRLALYNLKIPYVLVPPATLKKFITGKGNSPKNIMLKEIFKRFAMDFDDDNVADAYSLAQLGRAITGTNERPLVLLCHKSERRQQGHLGRARARWVAIWRRRVAMERGLCRSVLIGSAAGLRFARQVG
jgi:hypothetical protein